MFYIWRRSEQVDQSISETLHLYELVIFQEVLLVIWKNKACMYFYQFSIIITIQLQTDLNIAVLSFTRNIKVCDAICYGYLFHIVFH